MDPRWERGGVNTSRLIRTQAISTSTGRGHFLIYSLHMHAFIHSHFRQYDKTRGGDIPGGGYIT